MVFGVPPGAAFKPIELAVNIPETVILPVVLWSVIPVPTCIVSLSIVTDPLPTVKTPIIRASPSTNKAVVAVPVFTTTPFLNVPRPIESTFFTSS